ncbi:hypothetical protein [Cohnella pontilimi]|uniref:hypothetical protein n=1 Tax=Cohnella pontilimi TaxID=2564100 RepID=UPI00145D1ECF|nr:hypothetical protein [Cohnella pontilimi]
MLVRLAKRDEQWLSLQFPYKKEWVDSARRFKGSRWIPKEKVWVFSYTLSNVQLFLELFSIQNTQVDEALLAECDWLREWISVHAEGTGERAKELGKPLLSSAALRE